MGAKSERTVMHTTYIQASPERVWQGLTDPDLMKRYRRHQKAGPKTFRSDWKKVSTFDMAHDEVGLVVSGPDQVILEADPPGRLAYSWHNITPEWAAAVGMDEATAAIWRAEPRPKVAFDIEDVGHGVAKFTVTHDGFAPGSAVLPAISEGWPPSCPVSRRCWRRARPCALPEELSTGQTSRRRGKPQAQDRLGH
jgi:uncharacterized protein YndB with AHSA1/START domain